MQQHELRQPPGAKRRRKRVGRGNASGHGTYSTRGLKGQKARSGGGVRPGFEGGQLPLVRRMARKRGFRNPFKVDYEEVNVGALARFSAGTEVTAQALREARLIRSARRPVKVLGDGDLTVALTVEASSFSKPALAKIEAAGGTIRWLNGEPATRDPETRKAKRRAEGESERAARQQVTSAKGSPAAEAPAKPKRAKAAAADGAGAEAPAAKAPRARKAKAEAPAEAEAGETAATGMDAPTAGQEEANDGAGS
jgi:large subunit ribosomal protein L15